MEQLVHTHKQLPLLLKRVRAASRQIQNISSRLRNFKGVLDTAIKNSSDIRL